jgi:hypothetical protein
MDITQVVEIPASRKLTIDVPPGVPLGPMVIAYMPELPTRRGKPVLGCARGQGWMADDFDAPRKSVVGEEACFVSKKKNRMEEDIVHELAGSWKDDRSVEEMIEDMRSSRITDMRVLEELDG